MEEFVFDIDLLGSNAKTIDKMDALRAWTMNQMNVTEVIAFQGAPDRDARGNGVSFALTIKNPKGKDVSLNCSMSKTLFNDIADELVCVKYTDGDYDRSMMVGGKDNLQTIMERGVKVYQFDGYNSETQKYDTWTKGDRAGKYIKERYVIGYADEFDCNPDQERPHLPKEDAPAKATVEAMNAVKESLGI